MAKYSFQNAKYKAEIDTFYGGCSMLFSNIDDARKGAVELAKEYHGIVRISKINGQEIGKVYGHTALNHSDWYYESSTPLRSTPLYDGTNKYLKEYMKEFNPKTGKLKR